MGCDDWHCDAFHMFIHLRVFVGNRYFIDTL